MKEKGFTLVELAIVLVIIGIILGAVMKGRDLIDNARAKRLASEINKWTVAMYTYMDQKGKLPGDNNSDGYIDSNPIDDLTDENFVEIPRNTLTLGSVTFYLYPGVVNGTKNAIFICVNDNCTSTFSGYEKYIEMVDVSFDGNSSVKTGALVGITGTINVNGTTKTATVNPASLANNWTSAQAAIYYF